MVAQQEFDWSAMFAPADEEAHAVSIPFDPTSQGPTRKRSAPALPGKDVVQKAPRGGHDGGLKRSSVGYSQ